MTKAPEKVCERCGGTGKLVVDETTHRMCICLYNRKMRVHLGPELMSARPVFDSPLYQQVFDTEQGNLPTVDLTEKNLFLKSKWNDLLGHLTWAFYCKGPNWYFQIVTDERIRTVYVGNEHYVAKRRSRRDEVESNNSLHDLIGGEAFNLVIIRLGFLGYKNVAMAGALLEALRIREVQLKPTWIVEEPNSVFAPGHFSYSEELADYIHRRFEMIDMVKDPDCVGELRGVDTSRVQVDDDVEDERPRIATEDRPMRAVEASSTSSESSGLNMGTLFGNNKPKGGGYKKRGGGGGGGPV